MNSANKLPYIFIKLPFNTCCSTLHWNILWWRGSRGSLMKLECSYWLIIIIITSSRNNTVDLCSNRSQQRIFKSDKTALAARSLCCDHSVFCIAASSKITNVLTDYDLNREEKIISTRCLCSCWTVQMLPKQHQNIINLSHTASAATEVDVWCNKPMNYLMLLWK